MKWNIIKKEKKEKKEEKNLVMHDPNLTFYIFIVDIILEGAVPQNFDIGPAFFAFFFLK